MQVAVSEEEGSMPQSLGVQSALLSRLLQAAVAAKVRGRQHTTMHLMATTFCVEGSQMR